MFSSQHLWIQRHSGIRVTFHLFAIGTHHIISIEWMTSVGRTIESNAGNVIPSFPVCFILQIRPVRQTTSCGILWDRFASDEVEVGLFRRDSLEGPSHVSSLMEIQTNPQKIIPASPVLRPNLICIFRNLIRPRTGVG